MIGAASATIASRRLYGIQCRGRSRNIVDLMSAREGGVNGRFDSQPAFNMASDSDLSNGFAKASSGALCDRDYV